MASDFFKAVGGDGLEIAGGAVLLLCDDPEESLVGCATPEDAENKAGKLLTFANGKYFGMTDRELWVEASAMGLSFCCTEGFGFWYLALGSMVYAVEAGELMALSRINSSPSFGCTGTSNTLTAWPGIKGHSMVDGSAGL